MRSAREKIVLLLQKYSHFKKDKIIPSIKTRHGSCCTCQKYNYHYDNCVCSNNEIVAELDRIFGINYITAQYQSSFIEKVDKMLYERPLQRFVRKR